VDGMKRDYTRIVRACDEERGIGSSIAVMRTNVEGRRKNARPKK